MQKKGTGSAAAQPSLAGHVVRASKEPVVQALLLALVLVLFNLHFPTSVQESLLLLGRATGGLALFASGIVLFCHVAFTQPVGVSVLARNIVIPAIMWSLMLLFALPAETVREAVLTLAIPTASIVVILTV